jgi:hypothetical protein
MPLVVPDEASMMTMARCTCRGDSGDLGERGWR